MTAAAKKTTKQDVANSVVTIELVNIEGMLPVAVFTADSINEFIAKIEKEKNAFKAPDATTPSGRAAIIKFANRFTKTKTAVDDIGKDYVAILKDEPKRIDALRKLFRDKMDAWHDEVRKPVTLLEEADKKRKEQHEKFLADIGAQLTFPVGQPSSAEIERRMVFVGTFQQRSWEEFDELYQTTFKAVWEGLTTALAVAIKSEADAKELADLKAQKVKDEQEKQIEAARLKGIEEGQKIATCEPYPHHYVRSAISAAVTAPIMAPARSVTDEAKAKINREVLADLMGYGCKEEGAKALIKAIVTGTIRHVTINYGA